MKYVVIAIAMIIASTATFAQPKLKMEETYDWGRVTPVETKGEAHKLKARIILKNEGDKLLRITSVRPSCGCTSAPLEKDSLEPGEETALNITLNTPSNNGPITKYVTIQTNEIQHSTKTLTLKADIQRPLQLSSSFIPFNQGVVGQAIEGAMSITSYAEEPVSINVSAITPGLTIKSPASVVLKKGESYGLTCSYTPEKTGPFTVEVKLVTTLADYTDLSITGYGMAASADAMPQKVMGVTPAAK
ncbi:MAG: DUF1573 domain-containing protein ['Candidatus Kapabacteria' thiocyanatum]|uniref:Abnormal spindle-like microcephaly-associated protein ASH domain-containing protein n=1 Tax=Candidatus Kapaibacterium thiocyanatum TaxID=1895771 RepID=A0A1M3L5I9_9BACT|nr:DUF1573 domain-containing protein ['Candidatus Kapabacteria' thiocyanatum]OJX60821.1 MAG: hypothetical protein BGO89_04450 ['Candidatus Kapabacteria' thiocyanatum]